MRINGEPGRDEELCRYGTATVACGSRVAITGHGGEYAVRGDLTNTVVARVCDVEVALLIQSQAFRSAKLGRGRWPIVAPKARPSAPRNGRHRARRINLNGLVCPGLRHEHVSLRVSRASPGFRTGYHS